MQKINFTIEKNGLTYSDAIIIQDNENLSDDEIELIKQDRFDKWYQIITAPPIENDVEYVEEIVDGS